MSNKNYNKRLSETNIRIGECRFSYAHVFEPQKDESGKEKYSVAVLWPKADKAITAMVEAAVAAAKEKGKTTKWGGKIPANAKSPIRDGDIDREDDPSYAGMYFVNASNAKQKPGVRVLENGKVVEALDQEDFYSGCWGAVTLNFFPFDSNGNKGVGVGLNNVIKTRDDERLAGGATAEQDFGDLGDELD